MTGSDAWVVELVVDTERYPLSAPDSPAWTSTVARVQDELGAEGCSVLPAFIRSGLVDTLRAQGRAVAPSAHYTVETVNVYNIDLATPLPEGHPGRITMPRGNAFVARDQIDPSAVIHRLYTSELFGYFLARCFDRPRLYELADPLSALVLNVVRPGHEHPWHFDTNEFTVSLLTQQSEGGGVFEYCPNIRTADDEHLDDVLAVLTGEGRHLVRQLTLRPGDLQLFQGRYALHRVSEVTGATDRHTAIFAYTEQPGVIGSVARTRQLFGRVAPEHEAAERRVRVDRLLD
jgi:hypothetical protein